MSDKSFAEAMGYRMGVGDEVLGIFCPSCAYDRIRALPEVTYVETRATVPPHIRCVACEKFPMCYQAQELLKPVRLADFMGCVLKMAEREQQKRHPVSGR